jgi:hypothetical protein
MAAKWGDVLSKVTTLVNSESQSISQQDAIDPFAAYLSTEMKDLTPKEKDEFKFNCMDSLKKIKLSRT